MSLRFSTVVENIESQLLKREIDFKWFLWPKLPFTLNSLPIIVSWKLCNKAWTCRWWHWTDKLLKVRSPLLFGAFRLVQLCFFTVHVYYKIYCSITDVCIHLSFFGFAQFLTVLSEIFANNFFGNQLQLPRRPIKTDDTIINDR